MTAVDELALDVGAQGGDRQVGVELAGHVQGNAEILEVERDLEAQRVLVVDHPAAAVGEDPALGGSAAERLDHLSHVQAGLEGQHDPLRHPEIRSSENHLVHSLHRLTRTDRPDVGDRPANGREHRPRPFDVRGLPAAEDRQGRLLGAFRAARHRSVDEADTAAGQPLCGHARRGWRDGRTVHDQAAIADALGRPGEAEEHLLHVR